VRGVIDCRELALAAATDYSDFTQTCSNCGMDAMISPVLRL